MTPDLTFDKPTAPGWYATVCCWDESEGLFPGSHYWNGQEWREELIDSAAPTCGISHWPIVFESKDAAKEYARQHDPEM